MTEYIFELEDEALVTDPRDKELIELMKRHPIRDLDEATHRRAFDYAMAVVSAGGDSSRVPIPSGPGTIH